MCDHIGTPTQGYNEEGSLIWERELDSYGKPRMLQGDEGFCNYLYQGQTLDVDTGLAYNRFRYYDPEEGVYISQDPIGLLSGEPNLYCYVNDTNYWVDPLGLSKGDREKYLGRTPGKGSKTGKEVIERMRSEGTVKNIGGEDHFFDKKKQDWFPLANADMGHKHDAVKYWNTEGRFEGAKFKGVRKWMLDSNNYELQHFNSNRSEGAKLKDRYKRPYKKRKNSTYS